MIDKGHPLFYRQGLLQIKALVFFRDNAFYTSTVASVVKTLFDSHKFFTLIAHNTLSVTRSIARFVCDSWDLLWQLRFTPMLYLFIFFALKSSRPKNAAPRDLCQDVGMWYDADQRGAQSVSATFCGAKICKLLGDFLFRHFQTL